MSAKFEIGSAVAGPGQLSTGRDKGSKKDELRVETMSETQYEAYLEHAIAEYARLSPKYRELPESEALERSRNEFLSLVVPKGYQSEGQHFLAVLLKDQQIGYLHLGQTSISPKQVFAWNFHLDEPHREKGLGRATMEITREYLLKYGIEKITVSVLADNPRAIHLYESFGFKTTHFSMEKKLTDA